MKKLKSACVYLTVFCLVSSNVAFGQGIQTIPIPSTTPANPYQNYPQQPSPLYGQTPYSYGQTQTPSSGFSYPSPYQATPSQQMVVPQRGRRPIAGSSTSYGTTQGYTTAPSPYQGGVGYTQAPTQTAPGYTWGAQPQTMGTQWGQAPGTFPPGSSQYMPSQAVPYSPSGQLQGVPGQSTPLPGYQVPFAPTPGVTVQGVPSATGLQQPYPGQPAAQQPGTVPPTSGVPTYPQVPMDQIPSSIQPVPVPEGGILPATLEPLSPFEQYVSGRIPSTISFDIKQFGYDLFPKTPVPIAGAQDVPVNSNYVIGPGDEIRVTVWGPIEGSWIVQVDRDGNITLPKAGVIGVTGLSFSELKDAVQKELAKYYTDFQFNVSMGALKTIRVYVVGNARFPGAYTVSSLSTVINALIMAGGPSKSGSMRNVQLKRGGKTVAELDLYDFLIYGDKSKDQRLTGEDVIFIPSVGSMVGVAGNVERPAIYEMKGKTKLSEAIKMAGGALAEAYLQRVQVERVFQKQSKVVIDLNMQSLKGKDDVYLESGDIVKIFSVSPVVTNVVSVQGNVKRPGEYEWKQGMRVSDILKSYDNLLPDTLMDRAVIERRVPPDNHQEYRVFNLEAMLTSKGGSDDIAVEPYDVIRVYNKWEMVEKPKVNIAGAVNVPGEFEYRPNMKLSDLIALAGGMKNYAFLDSADLTRVTPTQEGPKTQQINVNPGGALAGLTQDDILLQENDHLMIKSVPEWQIYKKVSIYGEVKFPGEYALSTNQTLSSLIERAGGFTDKAYLRGANLSRLSVQQLQQANINEMINKLQREVIAYSSSQVGSVADMQEAKIIEMQNTQKTALIESLKQIQAKGRMVINVDQLPKMRGSSNDIAMEEGDYLFIPSNPQMVQVVGAINNQSGYVFEPGKDYKYYIGKAGGYSRTADKGATFILKVDGGGTKPGGGLFWNSSCNQWQAGSPNQVEPGDTIVVPDQLEKVFWLRNIKDFTQIIYQVAVGAGVVLRAFE